MHKFGSLKTMYTVVYDKFFSSGQGIGGGNPEFEDLIESDAIFYENFAKHWYPTNARLLLYCHLLWSRQPPSFCLRTQPAVAQKQVGVAGTDVNNAVGHITMPPSSAKPGKQEKLLEHFATKILTGVGLVQDEVEKKRKLDQVVARAGRDEAIKRHFDLLNEDIVRTRTKKYKLSEFNSMEEVLIEAQLLPADVAAVALRLREEHILTPLAMTQLTMEMMVGVIKIPLGFALSIQAVLKNTDFLE
jgi:hypothetical protein